MLFIDGTSTDKIIIIFNIYYFINNVYVNIVEIFLKLPTIMLTSLNLIDII